MTKKYSRRILFCSTNIWRKIFLFQRNTIFKTGEKFIYSRSSAIPLSFTNSNVSIYTGKKWYVTSISRWAVGFKFGEFTWNKKKAMYKSKQLKKKKKK